MDKIICYTCITNGKDALKEGQVKGSARFIAFLSDLNTPSNTWEKREAINLFADPRRNARYHKLLPEFFFDCEYSIWLDGSIQILVDPQTLIDKYLADADIAVFTHPDRGCLYTEANICMERFLDNPLAIGKQIDKYRKEGYLQDKGLAETKVVIRRNNEQVRRFNKEWFFELTTNSLRDQVSFPYIAWKTGIKVNYMVPLRHPEYRNAEFLYSKHLTG